MQKTEEHSLLLLKPLRELILHLVVAMGKHMKWGSVSSKGFSTAFKKEIIPLQFYLVRGLETYPKLKIGAGTT